MADLINGTLIDEETKKKLMEEIKKDEENNHKQTFCQIKQLYKTAEGRILIDLRMQLVVKNQNGEGL